MKIFRRVLVFGLRLLNTLVPKKDIVLIASADGCRACTKALSDSIESRTDWRIIWVSVNARTASSYCESSATVLDVYSIRFWLALFSARWIVSTHGELGRFKAFKGQYFVNLWHGAIIKKLGHMWSKEEGGRFDGVFVNADLTTCTSEFQRGVLSLCFNVPMWKMSVVGLPRNDMVLRANKSRDNVARIVPGNYKKIIMYCPTHRKAEGKNTVQESCWSYQDFVQKYLTEDFIAYLKKNGIKLVVKLHPFEEKFIQTLEDNCQDSPVFYMTGELLDQKGLDLYDLLGGVDLLITDYSSMYIDYLIAERPIIYITNDLEEYSKTRGFVFDMYEDLTPGPKVEDYQQLMSEIDASFLDPAYYREQRGRARQLLNVQQEPCSQDIIEMMKQVDGMRER